MTPNSSRLSLIVGISGQVGTRIAALLGPNRVVGTSREQMHAENRLQADLATLADRKDDAQALIDSSGASVIYCVGGMTDVERCESERELAVRTNCYGPATLAAAARHVPFVYFSTDYIFNGSGGPYAEEAPADPINEYGKSKWMGELAVRAAHPNPLIIRTSGVYGPDPRGKNFLYALRNSVSGGRQFRVPFDQVSTPAYNRDLAAAAIELVRSGASGVFNICGPERISRLDFAVRAAKAMGLDTSQIVGVPTRELAQRAARPLVAGLLIDKLKSAYPGVRMRGIEESISAWTANGDAEVGL